LPISSNTSDLPRAQLFINWKPSLVPGFRLDPFRKPTKALILVRGNGPFAWSFGLSVGKSLKLGPPAAKPFAKRRLCVFR
jgi:hypothetical protein